MVKNSRKIAISSKKVMLGDNVETFYEKVITRFGNSAKVDAPKMYIGRRAYVVILKDWK